MLSFASSVITILVNVGYIFVVLSDKVDNTNTTAAVIVIVPFLMMSIPAVLMVTLSLFSRPIKADSTWFMFFVSTLAANLVAVVRFAGASVVSPDLVLPVSLTAQITILLTVPLYVWATFTLGRQLTIMPEARKLVITGPYAFSRHPLYVLYIFWSLLDIAVAQTLVVAGVAVLTIALLALRARSEEAILASTFPEDWARYSGRVGWVWRWSPPFVSGRSETARANPD